MEVNVIEIFIGIDISEYRAFPVSDSGPMGAFFIGALKSTFLVERVYRQKGRIGCGDIFSKIIFQRATGLGKLVGDQPGIVGSAVEIGMRVVDAGFPGGTTGMAIFDTLGA